MTGSTETRLSDLSVFSSNELRVRKEWRRDQSAVNQGFPLEKPNASKSRLTQRSPAAAALDFLRAYLQGDVQRMKLLSSPDARLESIDAPFRRHMTSSAHGRSKCFSNGEFENGQPVVYTLWEDIARRLAFAVLIDASEKNKPVTQAATRGASYLFSFALDDLGRIACVTVYLNGEGARRHEMNGAASA